MHEWACCRDEAADHSCRLLNHPNSFQGGMFKLNANFMQINCCTCSVTLNVTTTQHIFTQQCLLPPLTSMVKSSLFTYEHSSPLSLADRLRGCCANHSPYINNGCTFSRQFLYVGDKVGRWGTLLNRFE